MPSLSNARHELFAQCLASGSSISKAFVEAGYNEHRGNAHRLSANEHIKARVAELLTQFSARRELSKQYVLDGLQTVVDRCLQREAVIHKGRVIQYRFDPAGANRALELLGKELGMFVDRSEQDTNIRVISAQPVSEEDWEAKYVKEEPCIH